MLFINKYQPKNIDSFPEYKLLNNISNNYKDIPHIVFYGPHGSGKKTRIMALLNDIYNETVYTTKMKEYEFKKKKTYQVKYSNYHNEINPSIHKVNDFDVLNNYIKLLSSSQNVINKNNLKTLVIYNLDELSDKTQYSLRRIMEIHSAHIKIIFTANNISNICNAIKRKY